MHKLASGFEAVTQVRRNNPPTFALTMPNYSIRGTSPFGPSSRSDPPAVKTPAKPDRSLLLRRL